MICLSFGFGWVMKIRKSILLLATVLACAGPAICQSPKAKSQQADTVRAKGFRVDGGLVNLSEGDVECICSGVPVSIAAHQAFENGDSVRTGNLGRVEILLEPGYYLRLAANSELRLLDLSPTNLKIKLVRGSAILEIEMSELLGALARMNSLLPYPLTMLTPADDYAITRAGAYRFNVKAEASSELRILKGLAIVSGNRVSEGMAVTLRNGGLELLTADAAAADSFDTWSRARAAGLIEANKSLKKLQWYKQIKSGESYFDVLDPAESALAKATHTISARNGLVSFVEPGTSSRSGESPWEPLKAGGSLSNGERVRTAPESRAEIHPYPDFSLFLAGNTEIVFSEHKDRGVSLEIIRGSVVVGCTPDPKVREHNTLTLVAGNQQYKISEMGRTRLNVLAEGKSALLVYEGAVSVDGREVRAAKGLGRSLSGDTELSFNRQTQDGFDVWSSRSRLGNGTGRIRHFFSLGGLWFLNEATNQYTFVPKAWDYRSPYGGKYSIKYTAPNLLQRPRIPTVDDPSPRLQTSPPHPLQ